MLMWIKFVKPAPGYAYFEGNKVDMKDEKAAQKLIDDLYAIPLVSGDVKRDLPDDFPVRELLVREGLLTKKQVAQAIPVLKDIKGIGQNTVDKIVEYLTKETK